jgi:hypothetical protein
MNKTLFVAAAIVSLSFLFSTGALAAITFYDDFQRDYSDPWVTYGTVPTFSAVDGFVTFHQNAGQSGGMNLNLTSEVGGVTYFDLTYGYTYYYTTGGDSPAINFTTNFAGGGESVFTHANRTFIIEFLGSDQYLRIYNGASLRNSTLISTGGLKCAIQNTGGGEGCILTISRTSMPVGITGGAKYRFSIKNATDGTELSYITDWFADDTPANWYQLLEIDNDVITDPAGNSYAVIDNMTLNGTSSGGGNFFWDIGVFSATDVSPNGSVCNVPFESGVKIDVDGVTIIAETTNATEYGVCCYDYQYGGDHYCYKYRLTGITGGDHNFTVSKTGFISTSWIRTMSYNGGENVYLLAPNTSTALTVYVKDKTTLATITGATCVLYKSSGQAFVSTNWYNWNPTNSDPCKWSYIPDGAYYFTATKTGYKAYTSSIFYLTQSAQFTALLNATPVDLQLALVNDCSAGKCTVGKTLNFSLAFTGINITDALRVNIYTGTSRSIVYPLIENVNATPFYFTISGDRFDAGDNKVWLEYSDSGDDYSTNTVTFTLVSVSDQAETPIFTTGYPLADMLLTPWIIGLIVVSVLGGIGDVKMKGGGKVFMVAEIIGAIVLTATGLMNPFIGIGLIVLTAAAFVWLMRNMLGLGG